MKKILVALLSIIMVASCSKINRDKPVDKNRLLASDYRLFQDTPAWDLAKAVWDNNVSKIDMEIKKNPKLLNYQEPLYGMSLLHMSSYNGQFKSFKELLRLGANPNVYDSMHCTSPIIQCCQDFNNKTKYVAELIKYGANVNDVECLKGRNKQKTNRTPLIEASGQSNLDLVKLLVENGANINYSNINDEDALSSAVLLDHYDVILYLLQHGADCNRVLYKEGADDNMRDIYMRDVIKEYEDIKSAKEYPQIVEILKKKGCL